MDKELSKLNQRSERRNAMFDREIFFKINGRLTSDEKMLVLIPCNYVSLFEGHDFKDVHELSMALMHANCAAEARYSKRPWKVEEYEGDLRRILCR
jgi:hypothetical protein